MLLVVVAQEKGKSYNFMRMYIKNENKKTRDQSE